MVRGRNLRTYFWEQVAGALGLFDPQITTSRHSNLGDRLVGTVGDTIVETGTSVETRGQYSVEFTYALVRLGGLPAGLGIGEVTVFANPFMQVDLTCEGAGSKTVTARAVPIHMDGLRLEQNLDLDTFLTPQRREVICSLASDVQWVGEGHEVIARFDELPFPSRRHLSGAMSGDVGGTESMWVHRDRVVGLVKTVRRDSEAVALGLRADGPTVSNTPQ